MDLSSPLPQQSRGSREDLLHRMTLRIRQSLQLQEILQATAAEVRDFLAVDRVMIYRFHPDEHGEVIAEAIDDRRLPSLLGLHFPAGDIPPHARELFIKAQQRSIVDLANQQISWHPSEAWDPQDPIAEIRRCPVDPCHVEYLGAMGVASSVVVPILQAEQLWGLLVAHHAAPRQVPDSELRFLQMVVDQVTIAITHATLMSQVQAQAYRESTANRISMLLHSHPQPFQAVLATIGEALNVSGCRLHLFPTTGLESERYTWGDQPIVAQPADSHDRNSHDRDSQEWEQIPLCRSFQETSPQETAAETDRPAAIIAIADLYQDARTETAQAIFQATAIRSLLIVPLQQGQKIVGLLTLFRNAIETETLWAGKVDLDERQERPRQSFEAWRDHKTQQAAGWTEIDCGLVEAIKIHLTLAIVQHQLQVKIRSLNANLEQQVQQRTRDLNNVQFALDQSSIVSITDRQGVICYVNDKFCDISQYSREELLGQTHRIISSGFHPPDFFAQMWQTLTSGQVWQGEIKNRAKDGTEYWIDSTLVPLLDEQGQPYRYVAIRRDVTARKQAEEALRQKTQREALLHQLASQIRRSLDLDTILATAVHAIRDLLRVDRCHFGWFISQGHNSYWEVTQEARTAAVPDLTGRYPAAKVRSLGKKLLNLEILRVDRVEQMDNLPDREFLESLGMASVLVLPVQINSSRIGAIHCSHSQAPRVWQDSEVELLKLIADQLAIAIGQAELYKQSRLSAEAACAQAQQLKQALKDLRYTQAQLVQTEKMSSLGQLVAGVAHEINNPVNFIYGNLNYARDYTRDLLKLLQLYRQHYPDRVAEIQAATEEIDLDFLQEDLPRLLSSMKLGADRIQKIVLALRNFSRMDEAEVKAVDIHEGIDSTLMILQNRLKGTTGCPEIQIVKQYGSLPAIECYAGQLNQVFMNVLSNAIDALEEAHSESFQNDLANPAKITIQTQLIQAPHSKNQESLDWVRICMADNGPGMTEATQKRLFEPFFTTKPVGKGTGLGLSISYQVVVDKHGGQLACKSVLGQGSQFIIELPIVAQNSYQYR